MPTRYLKESIKTSDTINSLTWFEEVLFYRLIVSCDDYGRFDGRAAIIKNMLFPLKEQITLKAIESAIQKLASVSLIDLYVVDGTRFLRLLTWNTHQTLPRAKKSKYPDPIAECEADAEQLHTNVYDCIQMHTNVAVIDNRNRNRNRNREYNAREETQRSCAYGEYQNVLLSDEEFEKLKSEFPDYERRIEALSSYIASTGKKYKSHFATIRNWARKDKAEKEKEKDGHSKSYDNDDFFEAALRRANAKT